VAGAGGRAVAGAGGRAVAVAGGRAVAGAGGRTVTGTGGRAVAGAGWRPGSWAAGPRAEWPGTGGAGGMDGFERRSFWPPRLARRSRVVSGAAVARRALTWSRRRALARRGILTGREGMAGTRRLPGPERVRRREGIARPHPPGRRHGRRHGLLARAAGRAGRPPAGSRPLGRVRSCLVSGPWWRRSRAARGRPRLAGPAARYAARRRRLASTLRPGGRCGPRPVREPGGPGRSRGAWRAPVAGHVDQAAWRVHGRRVQDRVPLTARSRRRRRPVPVTSGPAARRASSGPAERENQQRSQPDDETRHAQSYAQAGEMTARVPADQVDGPARHDQDPARHDHHRADHRQGNDKPHPPGWDGVRAHRSTIASRFAPRKPYWQVRPSRLPLGAAAAEPFGQPRLSPRNPGDTLWP
jgi:hypothetical protein